MLCGATPDLHLVHHPGVCTNEWGPTASTLLHVYSCSLPRKKKAQKVNLTCAQNKAQKGPAKKTFQQQYANTCSQIIH